MNKVGGIFPVVSVQPGRCAPPAEACYGSVQGHRATEQRVRVFQGSQPRGQQNGIER